MSEQLRRMMLYIAVILLSGSLFTACSGLHVSGGVVGSLLSLIGIVVFVLSMSTTQTACEVKPCLSVIQEQPKGDGGGGQDTPDTSPDTRIGPCLTPLPPDRAPEKAPDVPDIGPCLTAPPPDARPEPADEPSPDRDAGVRPCLSVPPDRQPDTPDSTDTPDTKVGPCLSPPPPDTGGKDTVGPCLSPPPPDKMGMNDVKKAPTAKPSAPTKLASRADERSSAIARLQQRGVLPPDVAARLQPSPPKKKG